MNPLLLGPVWEIIKQVLGGLGLDPALKEKAQAQALDVLTNGTFDQRSAQALALAQIGVNSDEAKTDGIFKGGWRPFTGWQMSIGVGVVTVWFPITAWIIEATTGHKLPPLPVMDTGTLIGLLTGLLGIGGLRSYDKKQGTA